MKSLFNQGNFVQHPVFKDRFVRKDKFNKLFRVVCTGSHRFQMYDEHPDLAFFWKSGYSYNFGYSSTLEKAVRKAQLLVHKCLVTGYVKDESKKYIEDEYNPFTKENDLFSPEIIRIFDSNNKLVLSGVVKGHIEWLVPASTYETQLIKNRVTELAKEAAHERYCDCPSSAESLDKQAVELKGFIAENSYSSYVKTMIDKLGLPNRACPLSI